MAMFAVTVVFEVLGDVERCQRHEQLVEQGVNHDASASNRSSDLAVRTVAGRVRSQCVALKAAAP